MMNVLNYSIYKECIPVIHSFGMSEKEIKSYRAVKIID